MKTLAKCFVVLSIALGTMSLASCEQEEVTPQDATVNAAETREGCDTTSTGN
jgi:hypothetical protein